MHVPDLLPDQSATNADCNGRTQPNEKGPSQGAENAKPYVPLRVLRGILHSSNWRCVRIVAVVYHFKGANTARKLPPEHAARRARNSSTVERAAFNPWLDSALGPERRSSLTKALRGEVLVFLSRRRAIRPQHDMDDHGAKNGNKPNQAELEPLLMCPVFLSAEEQKRHPQHLDVSRQADSLNRPLGGAFRGLHWIEPDGSGHRSGGERGIRTLDTAQTV